MIILAKRIHFEVPSHEHHDNDEHDGGEEEESFKFCHVEDSRSVLCKDDVAGSLLLEWLTTLKEFRVRILNERLHGRTIPFFEPSEL